MVGVIFGPPGSGKGTQAASLEREFGLQHLSTGDELRAEAARSTPVGKRAARLMAAGELVPDDLILHIVEERLGAAAARPGILLDGFPRTVEQARGLDELLARVGRKVDFVLALEAPAELLVARLLERASVQGRIDDTPEAIEERMREYRALSTPVLDYYRNSGVPVQEVDATGSVEDVFGRISEALKQIQVISSA